MKRMAFFAIFVATSLIASTANAGGWDDFHGTYEMIATGICLHSTSGWTKETFGPGGFNGWKPTAPVGDVWAGTATTRGEWIFKRDGTGTFQGTNYAAIFPGASKTAHEYTHNVGFPFTYEITNNGVITVTHSGNGLVMNGMLSIDKNIMTLLSASQPLDQTSSDLGWLVMDAMRILIKVRE